MLEVDEDDCGVPIFKVINPFGKIILITGDGLTAIFVNSQVDKMKKNQSLVIGGDPGTKYNHQPQRIFKNNRK